MCPKLSRALAPCLPRRSLRRSLGSPARPDEAGFTLIEVLLVVLLMAIAVAIAWPSFVRSFQGQRLSTAARTLVTVTRYARSMAVLKQSDLVLTFNLANGQIDLVSSNTSLPSFSRVVSGVRLQEVAIEGAEPLTEGVGRVQFLRNGVCNPFVVTLADRSGNQVRLSVDALGSVKSKVFGTQ
ncbi:MAG: prepilin-type N-terminal cleavage/methylation domain-containing protein [Lentisphaerae bacterium]|nr:prepilin-type N-terminal cleavage/methylation domain-containing protein [Lentisphaerota bacterium]